MTDIYALCTEIATGYEPTAANRDDSRVAPVEYVPGKLYLYPLGERFPSADTGGSDEWRYRVQLDYVVSAEQEEAGLVMDGSISQTLQAKVQAIAAWVRAHRAGTNFEWLQIDSVDYRLVTTHARGFHMELSGYQYQTP